MASNIDPLEPQEGLTATADTRANFSAAKTEIEDLQAKDASQDTDIAGKEPANPNIQAHIADVISNPHAVNKAQVGLANADNTSDADKPISDATQAALDGKEPTISPKNTAFNRNFTAFGVGDNGVSTEVARGDHSHQPGDIGAAPDTHVGDSSHLSADERAGMTIANPSAIDPLITQNDLNAHTANNTLHVTPNQNDALDNANAPAAGNPFATIADIPAGSGHVIQNPAGTPMPQQPNLQFIGDVEVTDDAGGSRTVVNVTAGAGTGEANTASNVGAGEGVFAQKIAVDLQFKSLLSGNGGILLSSDADEITATLQYAGSSGNFGTAFTVARSDHAHAGVYLGVGAKAADSDLLDGLDSTDFALAADFNTHVAAPLHLPAGGTATQALTKVDGADYNTQWADVIQDVPSDNTIYARQNGAWVVSPLSPIGGLALTYTFSISTTPADPGAGGVKTNNVDQTLATEIYINDASAPGNDASSVITSLQTGDYVGLWEQQSDKESVYYTVTGPVVDNTGWYTIPVSAIPGTGAGGIDDAAAVTFQVFANENARLPIGGTTGQVLKKVSGTDYDVAWQNESGGGGGSVNVTETHIAAVGGQSTYSFTHDAADLLQVTYNGSLLRGGTDYTNNATANTITLNFTEVTGDDILVTRFTGESVPAPNLTDADFPTYAVFTPPAAADATVDFSDGNNQEVNATTHSNLTLSSPASKQGHFTLKILNSNNLAGITPSINWSGSTAPTWAGTSILSLYSDGTNWYGSALVDVGTA